MNARAQTIVHVSLEMTRQERDDFATWLNLAKAHSDALSTLATPSFVDMLISILKATETEKQLPISG